MGNCTLLPGLSELALQPFAQFAKPPVLFFQRLKAATQLRISARSAP
jgi:hypothetical protein